MPEIDAGPMIAEMAQVASGELVASVQRHLGISLDIVMIIRAPEPDQVMVMGMLVNDFDHKRLHSMLEQAFETVLKRKPDVDTSIVLP